MDRKPPEQSRITKNRRKDEIHRHKHSNPLVHNSNDNSNRERNLLLQLEHFPDLKQRPPLPGPNLQPNKR